jgi:hypothetical protein
MFQGAIPFIGVSFRRLQAPRRGVVQFGSLEFVLKFRLGAALAYGCSYALSNERDLFHQRMEK